jgi:hypothetical protein
VALRGGRKRKSDTVLEAVPEAVDSTVVTEEQTNQIERESDDSFVATALTEQPRPEPAEEENTVSEQWSEQPVEEVVAQEGTEPVEGEVTEQAAEAPKEPEVRLDEQFPQGAVVRFTKTDWKGQFGTVDGIEDKRNVQYVNVLRTHLTNGKPIPAEKQGPVSVRYTSLEVVDESAIPEYKEPAKEEPKAEAAAE